MFHYHTNVDIINHQMALHLKEDRNIPVAIIILTARLYPEASWWDCGRNRRSWKEKKVDFHIWADPAIGLLLHILVYILLQNTINLTLLIFDASSLDLYLIVFTLFLRIKIKNKRITCFSMPK